MENIPGKFPSLLEQFYQVVISKVELTPREQSKFLAFVRVGDEINGAALYLDRHPDLEPRLRTIMANYHRLETRLRRQPPLDRALTMFNQRLVEATIEGES